jgi:serine/threonine-protein kinase
MQIPATVGKYELLEFLGGGMSHVYRARDTVIERPVVVKLLTEDACRDTEAKARFLQEAKLAGNIQHENIVSVFDFGEHEGRPFIVMEYLKGRDLRDAIRGGHLGSLFDRLRVALQIADALEYVNGRGIVHRDIKPENVHIDPNGKVKLMDFGIAKTEDLSLTKTGMTMGTPYYMAPEQVVGRPVTALTDVYAFGMLFFELLTSQRAVSGDAIEAVLFQILHRPLDPAPMEKAGVPPEVRGLVLRCVEKNPEDRPQGFRVVAEELRGLIAGLGTGPQRSSSAMNTVPFAVTSPPATAVSTTPASPSSNAAQKSRGALWVVLAVVLIAIAGGAAWWFTQGRTPPAPPAIAGMVYFPAGSFLWGPQNTPVSLPAFYMDETEVSNAEFAQYCRAMGCSAPEGAPDLPVVRVTVAQAREYAAWKGKRLPSAQEWERAARGTNGAKFPWGDAPDASLANISGTGLKPVKSYAPYQMVYQMAGNASEMVEEEITPSAGAKATFASRLTPPLTDQDKWITMRGGSFNTNLAAALTYEFVSIPERYSSSDIGFRCAKSVK